MASLENCLRSEQIALLDNILAAATEPIYVFDRLGRYRYVSPAGLAALGLQASDVLGKSWRDLNLPAEVMERHDAEREAVFQRGIPVTGETRYPTANGIRHYEYVISPMWGQNGEVEAVINTSRDITERQQAAAALRQLAEELEARVLTRTEALTALNQSLQLEIAERQKAEQALRESESRFSASIDAMLEDRERIAQTLAKELLRIQTLFETAFDGIVILDKYGNVLEANPRFAEMLGYAPAEIARLTVFDWEARFAPADLQQLMQHCLRNRRGVFETQHRRKDGSVYDVEISYNVVVWEGEILRFCVCRDITERKQAEASAFQFNRELQQKVTELQTLLDVIPIGIGIAEDPDCRHIRVNPAFAQSLGIPPTVNASLSAPEEERPTSFKVYQNGQELAPEELPLQYAATHGVEMRDLEVEVVWQDGTLVTLLEYAAPLWDEQGQPRGSVGAFLNITERKRAEQALRESEERYRALAQNFPNGSVLLFDHDLRYVLAEGQGLADGEIDRASLVGKTLEEVFDAATCWSLEPYYRAALAGNAQVAEITFKDQIYSVHYLPVYDDQGQVNLGMVMSQNVTLQKQAEQVLRTARDELERQVQARTQALQQLTEELQRSNQELEQFAYVASHDLQEPLRAVASFTQMLAKRYQGQLDAKADMYIEFIVDGATRMQQLIKDLLAYSRAGRYELKRHPIDFNTLLERVKQDLQVAIAETRAVITADPLPTLTIDANQMATVLQNLIGNSIKYRSAADPRIHLSAKIATVEVTKAVTNAASHASSAPSSAPLPPPVQHCLFSIQDNGIGIDPRYAERIFTIFQRLHTSDEYSGTGLGLAICRKIIERHAGRIWVESQLEQGATFFFTLPLAVETQDDTSCQSTQDSPG